MRISQRKRTRPNRQGAVLVLFLVLFPLLILIVGFSIDFAHMQCSRTELRRATDLAVKAAALSLSQDPNEALATQLAIDVAGQNLVAGKPLQLAASDVTFGTSAQQPDGSFSFVAGVSPRNSVKIIGDRTAGSLSGPIGTYFGALYNAPTFEPVMAASAGFVNTDICLVLDRSSSMKWNAVAGSGADTAANPCLPPTPGCRWVGLEAAVNAFIDSMENSPAFQKVAMITFASDLTMCGTSYNASEVDVPLVGDLSRIRMAMANRTASVWAGNTDIAVGIQEGQSVLTGIDARSTAYKVMIVMTDGQYTEDDPVPYARIANANGIQVHTITFSDGANEADMIDVANAGNGLHYHANSVSDLTNVFESIAGTISRVIE